MKKHKIYIFLFYFLSIQLYAEITKYIPINGKNHAGIDLDGAHLHLSYYKKMYIEQKYNKKIVYSDDSKIFFGNLYNNDFKNSRRDPFDHNSIKHKGFGR